MAKISNDTASFLNAVVNPFGASATARVTDTYSGNTICLTDWLDVQPVVEGEDDVPYQGICWIFLPGYSNLKAGYSDDSSVQYQVCAMPILASGLIGLTAGGKLSSVNYYRFSNYGTITGNAGSYDADDCLVDAYRIFSAGLRAWPTTEVVTNTSTTHVTRYYGGLITPNSVYRSIIDGNNFINIVKQIDSIKMYPAYEGVTVRYNPFQDLMLNMRSLANWNMQAHDFSGIEVPIIMSLFSANVSGLNGNSSMSYINARVWLEGSLSLPTPIYSNASPMDLNFDLVRQVMSRPTEKHPFVTGGHTFEAFAIAAGGLATTLDLAAYAFDHLGSLAYDLSRGTRGKGNARRARANAPKRNRKLASKGNGKKKKSKAPKQVLAPVPQYRMKRVRNTK